MLFLAKVDLLLKKQGCKENALGICGTSSVNMVFALSIDIVAFYMRAIIIKVKVSDFKSSISRFEICFAICLAFNKQFQSQASNFFQIYIDIHICRIGSESKVQSESKSLIESRSLSSKDSQKKCKSITILIKNISNERIFSINNRVAIST